MQVRKYTLVMCARRPSSRLYIYANTCGSTRKIETICVMFATRVSQGPKSWLDTNFFMQNTINLYVMSVGRHSLTKRGCAFTSSSMQRISVLAKIVEKCLLIPLV
jgi:hypothetical protein